MEVAQGDAYWQSFLQQPVTVPTAPLKTLTARRTDACTVLLHISVCTLQQWFVCVGPDLTSGWGNSCTSAAVSAPRSLRCAGGMHSYCFSIVLQLHS